MDFRIYESSRVFEDRMEQIKLYEVTDIWLTKDGTLLFETDEKYPDKKANFKFRYIHCHPGGPKLKSIQFDDKPMKIDWDDVEYDIDSNQIQLRAGFWNHVKYVKHGSYSGIGRGVKKVRGGIFHHRGERALHFILEYLPTKSLSKSTNMLD